MSDTTTGPAPEPTTASQADNEPLGSPGMRALEAERERRRVAVQRADKAEARVTELELGSLRSEIATKTGVPADLLVGATAEELEAHAARLAEFRGGDSAKPPSVGRPKEKLRGGASPPDLDDQPDMGKVADKILHRGL